MLKYPRPKGLKDTIERMEALKNRKVESIYDLLIILVGIRDTNERINKELVTLKYCLHEIPNPEGRKQCEEDILLLQKYRILAWIAQKKCAEIGNFVMEEYASFDVFENKIMSMMSDGLEEVESQVIANCTDFTTPSLDFKNPPNERKMVMIGNERWII